MEGDQHRAAHTHRRRGLRFSLKSAMVLILLFAVGLGAFRFGREVGFQEGNQAGFVDGINAKVYPKVYRVSDILLGPIPQSGQPDYALLLNEIICKVQPTTWEEAGGPATNSTNSIERYRLSSSNANVPTARVPLEIKPSAAITAALISNQRQVPIDNGASPIG